MAGEGRTMKTIPVQFVREFQANNHAGNCHNCGKPLCEESHRTNTVKVFEYNGTEYQICYRHINIGRSLKFTIKKMLGYEPDGLFRINWGKAQ